MRVLMACLISGFSGAIVAPAAAQQPAGIQEESVARGFADVVRAQGMRELQQSEVVMNSELARRQYIENRMLATQTYLDMRRLNQEARRSDRPSPLPFDSYVRLARQQAPNRLSVSDLDPLTGAIYWPPGLRKENYAADRGTIETAFRQRAAAVASNSGEIVAACDRLLLRLNADVNSFVPNDFILAKNFIASLKYEASLAYR